MILNQQYRLLFPSLIILDLLLMCAPAFSQTWEQLGMSLSGEAASDFSGNELAISEDGLTVAIGAQGNDGSELVAGHVRVYRFINGEWTQLGEDIDGEAEGDYSGSSVSLNADGAIVAIGADGNNDGGTDAGQVRVFQFINDEWVQMGSDIDGEDSYDQFGHSLDLSADGSIVAVGAYGNDDFAPSAGHVRVFQLTSGDWVQIGQDIDGQLISEWFGISIGLSGDGTIVAAGASQNHENGANVGEARVYQFVSGEWIQMGTDIENDIVNSYFGRRLSISADGQQLAIEGRGNTEFGAPFVSSQVKIFQFISGDWEQLGDNIVDTLTGNASNRSIDLSADGSTLAVGSQGDDQAGNNVGKARAYRFASGEWIVFGADIFGEAESDFFGSAIGLSADGTVMAVGASENDESGTDAGQVKVYSTECPPPTFGTDFQTSCGSYTWIDGNTYTSDNDTSTFQLVSFTGCDSIVTLDLTITDFAPGIDTHTACDTFIWLDGNTYTSNNNTATYTFSTPGCDSTVTLDLTIINSSSSMDTQTACESFVWIDGNTYTVDNNIATYTLINSTGCDSLITLYLTVNSVDTSLSIDGTEITSNALNANFQWLDCDNAFASINGEMSSSFIPESSGNYAVEIIQNGCIDTSECVSFIPTGIEESGENSEVKIFPNPTFDLLNIDLGDLKNVSIRVLDSTGQVVFQKKKINTTLYQLEFDHPVGVYFIEISNQVQNQKYRLVKL